jgi:hypothetical protein
MLKAAQVHMEFVIVLRFVASGNIYAKAQASPPTENPERSTLRI